MDCTTRFVETDSVRLHVREWGAQNAPTVVMVHGYPDCSRVWVPTAEQLAKDFHVVAYDVRGAGLSTAPNRTSDYRLEHLAEDFRAVIDAVSPDRAVHLVAHDWGSIQSWESVADPALSERIASFTSISGPSLDHVGQLLRQRLGQEGLAGVGKVANQVMHSWYIWAFHLPGLAPLAWKNGLGKLWPRLLTRLEGIADPAHSASQAMDGALGVKLYRANIFQRLAAPRERATAVPVLQIEPTRDPFVTAQLLDETHRWAPRLWRQSVNAGHWYPLSHPAQLAGQVREFVGMIEAGAEAAMPSRLRRFAVTGPRSPRGGQLAIITGAGNGIGRETLLGLAAEGAEVVGVDLDADALSETLREAKSLGAVTHAQVMDVGEQRAWEEFSAWVETELGAPDILVNNAGIGMAGQFLDTAPEDWEKILRVNVWSVIHGARLFGRQMQDAAQAGQIVNVASAAAFAPSRTMSAYSTTKAAVRMLSDCMRAELASKGIHVITVCPGVINTGITDRSTFVGSSEAEQQQKRQRASAIYARRNLGPEAVSRGILDGLSKRRDEVLVGVEAYGLNALGRLTPGLSRRLAQIDMA